MLDLSLRPHGDPVLGWERLGDSGKVHCFSVDWPEPGRWHCLSWPCYCRVWAKSYADGVADTGHLLEARRSETTPLEGNLESDKRTKPPEGTGLAEMWESSEAVPSQGGKCWQDNPGPRVRPRASSSTLHCTEGKGSVFADEHI